MARTAVIAGTATAVSGKVAQSQHAKYEAQQAAAGQPAPVAGAAPAEEDPILVIQKLAALRDQGILTEEEFTAKKAQILGI
jgi:hypothetical protein